MLLADQLEDRQPVHAGHTVIEQHDVGPVLGDERQDLVAALGHADDFELLRVLQSSSDSGDDQQVIIGDADPNRHSVHSVEDKARSKPNTHLSANVRTRRTWAT